MFSKTSCNLELGRKDSLIIPQRVASFLFLFFSWGLGGCVTCGYVLVASLFVPFFLGGVFQKCVLHLFAALLLYIFFLVRSF